MNKKLLSIIILCGIVIGGCDLFKSGPDPEVELLKDKLETLEKEKADAEAKAKAEAAKLERENELKEAEAKLKAEEAKEKADAAEKKKLQDEIDALKKKSKALPKFGPGNQNHMGGPADGYVSVCTRSAEGKLTLRSTPNQGGTQVKLIPNGTYGIYYYNRTKVGEYVWYEVEYSPDGINYYFGWLRGDYLCY